MKVLGIDKGAAGGQLWTLVHRRDRLKAQAVLQQQFLGNPKAQKVIIYSQPG